MTRGRAGTFCATSVTPGATQLAVHPPLGATRGGHQGGQVWTWKEHGRGGSAGRQLCGLLGPLHAQVGERKGQQDVGTDSARRARASASTADPLSRGWDMSSTPFFSKLVQRWAADPLGLHAPGFPCPTLQCESEPRRGLDGSRGLSQVGVSTSPAGHSPSVWPTRPPLGWGAVVVWA